MNRIENFYKILIKNKTSEFLLLFYLLFIKFKEIVIIPRVTAVNEKVNGIFFLFTAFTFTFLIRINLNNINMKKQKESIKVLTELDYKTRCSQTKMPKEYVPKKSFSDNTANGLEKCIVLWCKLNGWLCERVKNTGRYIDESKIVTDFMGNTKRIGTGKFIKGTGTNGTADCRAIIKGRSISFEVKIGRDVQSDAQKEYQLNVEKSGGLYFIVKDFDNFIEIYKGIIEGKYEKIQNNNN